MWDCWPFIFASVKPLGHCRSIPSLRLFNITLVDVHLNWMNWFHVLILVAGPLVIVMGCIAFLSVFENVYINSFFYCQGYTLESFACRSLFFDLCLSDFKSSNNFIFGVLSKELSNMLFKFFDSFSSNSMPFSGC